MQFTVKSIYSNFLPSEISQKIGYSISYADFQPNSNFWFKVYHLLYANIQMELEVIMQKIRKKPEV